MPPVIVNEQPARHRTGDFRGRSSDDAAEALIALYEGTTVLWALDQTGTAWAARAQLALRLILDGMQAGHPPTP